MSRFSSVWHWLSRLRWRRVREQEIDEEIRFHLEAQIERNLAAGMTPEDARAAASRQFGNIALCKEGYRESRMPKTEGVLETLLQDAHHGMRMLLRRQPMERVLKGFFSLLIIIALLSGSDPIQGTSVRAQQDRASSKPLLIDDFENTGEGLSSRLGTKWNLFTDQPRGGTSTIQGTIAQDGAENTKKSFQLSGTVTTDFQYGYAGASLSLNHAEIRVSCLQASGRCYRECRQDARNDCIRDRRLRPAFSGTGDRPHRLPIQCQRRRYRGFTAGAGRR
jgi:hypothetical protein